MESKPKLIFLNQSTTEPHVVAVDKVVGWSRINHQIHIDLVNTGLDRPLICDDHDRDIQEQLFAAFGYDHDTATKPAASPNLVEEVPVDAPWASQNLCVIDFETTGLDASNGDRALELAVVCIDHIDGVERVTRRTWMFNPGMEIPLSAVSVHGITDDMVADAPPFMNVAAEIADYIGQRIPVAYNAKFDREFLHTEMRIAGIVTDENTYTWALRPSVEWIDPLVWVKHLHKFQKGKKLTDAMNRLGVRVNLEAIGADERRAHRAIYDAVGCGGVLFAMSKKLPPKYGELISTQTTLGTEQRAEAAAYYASKNGG